MKGEYDGILKRKRKKEVIMNVRCATEGENGRG